MLALIKQLLRPRPADRREELVDSMIKASKRLGAKTPRQAAEIASGRRYTEEEWQARREIWLRRWY